MYSQSDVLADASVLWLWLWQRLEMMSKQAIAEHALEGKPESLVRRELIIFVIHMLFLLVL